MTEIKSLIDKCKTLIATCDDMEKMLCKNKCVLEKHIYNIKSIQLEKAQEEYKLLCKERARINRLGRLEKKKKEEAERYKGWGRMYW